MLIHWAGTKLGNFSEQAKKAGRSSRPASGWGWSIGIHPRIVLTYLMLNMVSDNLFFISVRASLRISNSSSVNALGFPFTRLPLIR